VSKVENYSSRRVVIDILSLVFQKDVFFQDAFARCMAGQEASAHRAYVFRLSKGVTERYVTLLALLKKLSATPVSKIRPEVLMILLAALYELTYMDTPDHAVVNDSVKLTASMGYGGLRGFVNGNLRSYLRRKEELMASLRISERLGLPDELFLLLKRTYGLELTEKMALSFFKEEKITVRRLTSRVTEEEFSGLMGEEGAVIEKTGITDHSFYSSGIRPENSEAFLRGLYYVQDLSSMLDGEVGAAVLSGPGPFNVLDLCAAPGGKSLDILDALAGRLKDFVSCDLSEAKVSLLRENFTRCGFIKEGCPEVLVSDASVHRDDFSGRFDLVVADVPCSGIGIIGRKPDIRFHVSPDSLREIEALQAKILRNAADYVRPGGYLLYSTCTLNPGENRKQTEAFLLEDERFEEVDVHPYLPEAYRAPVDLPALPAGKDITVIPGLHPSDGFYVCLMKKRSET